MEVDSKEETFTTDIIYKRHSSATRKICLVAIAGQFVLFVLLFFCIGFFLNINSNLKFLALDRFEKEALRNINLSKVSEKTLAELNQFGNINLRWGEIGSPTERSYHFQVEAAQRDGETGNTTLFLTGNHHIKVSKESATLFDAEGKEQGKLEFEKAISVEEGSLRKLIGYDNYRPGSATFFDAYCRYGCGNMAVTFPYYYRPFFGYGYPLVGMDNAFPAGYGGNPVTQLSANGVMGVPGNQQMASALSAAGV
eukprot:GHVP01003789.1.p1 GENE.GHVP01003789.1~~GHVP01003789.1.p1  ORF type:complete len:253 (-),score=47.74 GHVP01003789.1:51-809(-)